MGRRVVIRILGIASTAKGFAYAVTEGSERLVSSGLLRIASRGVPKALERLFIRLRPLFVAFDMTASKKFPIREKMFLEYRADVFNLMNHTNFGVVSGNYTMSSGSFGQLGRTSAFNGGNLGGPRVIQMTLKLQF